MNDYTGSFRPDLAWEDFSKEKLIEFLNLYSNLFLAVDGFWYLGVKERFEDRTAIEVDLWVWEKFIRYELKRITKLMKIDGNDVESLFKALQLGVWGGNVKAHLHLRDRKKGVFRAESCPTLEALKKEGQGRDKYFCRQVEQPMFEMYARFFNPEIQVKALSIPPESEGSGVCCEWEFSLP